MTVKQDDLLQALLDADFKPQKDVTMRRFGVFSIQSVDDADLKTITEMSTWGGELDTDTFKSWLIVKGCVKPDWSNPQLLTKFNATDAAEVVKKRLLPGERERLYMEINDISGFSENEAKVVEELKK